MTHDWSAFNNDSRGSRLDDYGTGRGENGTIGEGLDPPLWLKRTDFIHQASSVTTPSMTIIDGAQNDSFGQIFQLTTAIVKREVDELHERIIRTFSQPWSSASAPPSMLDQLINNTPDQTKIPPTCPLFSWG